jgi:hypothetical protein
VEHRKERIKLQTVGHSIEGDITLARDGYRSRVSDVLNASERDFLTLTDVVVTPLEGGPPELHAFLALARRSIVFAVVAEDADIEAARVGGEPDRGVGGEPDRGVGGEPDRGVGRTPGDESRAP